MLSIHWQFSHCLRIKRKGATSEVWAAQTHVLLRFPQIQMLPRKPIFLLSAMCSSSAGVEASFQASVSVWKVQHPELSSSLDSF